MTRAGAARVVVSGMVAGDPHQGGASWAILQYLLGLRRLGHEAWLVEPVPAPPTGAQVAYARAAMAGTGFEDRWALVHGDVAAGMTTAEVTAAFASADVHFDVAGMLVEERLTAAVPVRVYLDLDPAFVQLWQVVDGIDMRFDGHTHFVTVGGLLGTPECDVPTAGHSWTATLPPVVLERWPAQASAPRRGLTTIANWRGYGSIEHAGVHYGQKAHSFRPLFALPRAVKRPVEVALSIDEGEVDDIAALDENGWVRLDPCEAAGTPEAYRAFVQSSWAEIGIAKSGYVRSRCGWFSDRSACYLASGRPVLAQDTGWSRLLPAGRGLLAFSTLDEAVDGVASIEEDYAAHAAAARAVAEEHFDSDAVLGALLARVGAG